jgi:hypothetical protein
MADNEMLLSDAGLEVPFSSNSSAGAIVAIRRMKIGGQREREEEMRRVGVE